MLLIVADCCQKLLEFSAQEGYPTYKVLYCCSKVEIFCMITEICWSFCVQAVCSCINRSCNSFACVPLIPFPPFDNLSISADNMITLKLN